MKFRVIGIVLLTFMIFPTEELAAQLKGISKGDSVRIWAPSIRPYKLTGKVLDMSPDKIRLHYSYNTPPWRDIPLTTISDIEVFEARSQAWRGAKVGFITGGLGIGFLAMAGSNSCDGDNDSFCFEFSPGALFLGGALVGSISGALIGTIIGSTMKREEWRKVRFEVDTIAINTTQFDRDRIPGIMIKWSL